MSLLVIPIALEWVILVTTLAPMVSVGRFNKTPRLGITIWFLALLSAGFAVALAAATALFSILETYLRLSANPVGSDRWLLALVTSFAPWLILAIAGISLALVNQRVAPLLIQAKTQLPALEASFKPVSTFEGYQVYCANLPFFWAAVIRGRIVVSSHALDNLTDSELSAVLWHEVGHIQGRHNLIKSLAGFVSLLSPGLTASRMLSSEVYRLAELDADRIASRHVSDQLLRDTRSRFTSL